MNTRKNNLGAFFFCIPGLLMLAIFVYFPLIENIIYSFQSFSLSSTSREFVGLNNYRELFSDPIIWQSIKNNLLYAVISILFQVVFGLVVAAILEDKVFRKSESFFQTIFFIPTLLSMTVVCLLFEFVYNPQMGLLNSFLELTESEELSVHMPQRQPAHDDV